LTEGEVWKTQKKKGNQREWRGYGVDKTQGEINEPEKAKHVLWTDERGK